MKLPFSTVLLVFAGVVLSFCGPAKSQTLKIPTIVPPDLPNDRLELDLPDFVKQIKVGGAGRYLLLQFESLQTIGLFDVNEAKIVHSFPATDPNVRFAAGADRLLMISGKSKEISVYDLESHKLINAVPFDNERGATHVIMGSASMGSALVYPYTGAGRTVPGLKTLDTSNLKFSSFEYKDTRRGISISAPAQIRLSPMGNTIGMWNTNLTRSGLFTFVKQSDDTWQPHLERSSVGYVVPSTDGSHVFTQYGAHTNQLTEVFRDEDRKEFPVPAIHGPFYVSVSNNYTIKRWNARNSGSTLEVTAKIKMLGSDADFGEVSGIKIYPDKNVKMGLLVDERINLIPRANLLIQLANNNKQLILSKWDLDKQLSESGAEYLFFLSQPPTRVVAGDDFEYQVDVKSKQGEVQFDLVSAPEGMTISETGMIKWKTRSESPRRASIIASVTDKSRKQVFQSFELDVDGATGVSESLRKSAEMAKSATEIEQGPPAEENSAVYKTIKFPGAVGNSIAGAGGRLLFFHLKSLGKIAVVDTTQAKIVRYLPVPPKIAIAAGRDHLFIVDNDKATITRIGLPTLKTEQTRRLPFPGVVISMGIGCNSKGPLLLQKSDPLTSRNATFDFMNTSSLRMTKSKWPYKPSVGAYRKSQIHASAEGSLFHIDGVGLVGLDGNEILLSNEMALKYRDAVRIGKGPIMLGSEGKFIAFGGKTMDREMNLISDQDTDYGTTIPSLAGSYFLSYGKNPLLAPKIGFHKKREVRLYRFGEERHLATLQKIASPFLNRIAQAAGVRYAGNRVFFLSDIGVIATLDIVEDQLIWQRIDRQNLPIPNRRSIQCF